MARGDRVDPAAEERRRTAVALLAELEEARSSGAEWYRWIASGMPRLTEAEYERVGRQGARRARAAPRP